MRSKITLTSTLFDIFIIINLFIHILFDFIFIYLILFVSFHLILLFYCHLLIVISNRNSYRTTSEEKRHLERLNEDLYKDVRLAAEVHRQTRKYANSYIKPGMLMTDICEGIENTVRKLIEENGLTAGTHSFIVLLLFIIICYTFFFFEFLLMM